MREREREVRRLNYAELLKYDNLCGKLRGHR